MSPRLGEEFIDFEAQTHKGPISWHAYIEGSWALLFTHPADFAPVSAGELGCVQAMEPEFSKRGVKVAALCSSSGSAASSQDAWVKDVAAASGLKQASLFFPLIRDDDLAARLGVLDGEGAPWRALFVVGPDKRLKLALHCPAAVGRNFGEVLRQLDALQLTASHSVHTPANWKPGDRCAVPPALGDEEAAALLPNGVTATPLPSGMGYMRSTPDPR